MQTGLPNTTKIILAFLFLLIIVLAGLFLIRYGIISVNLTSIKQDSETVLEVPAPPADSEFVVDLLEDATVYSGPDVSYQIYGNILSEQEVEILGESVDKKWLAINLPTVQSGVGWIQSEKSSANLLTSNDNNTSNPAQIGTPSLVANADVDVYNGPGVRYEVLGMLLENQEAEILGVSSNRDWWLIRYPFTEGGQGWVADDGVTARNTENVQVVNNEEPADTGELATVTAVTNINIRSGPGTGYQILGKLAVGQTAVVNGISADGQWWYIDVPSPDVSRGWVSTAYVKAENTTNVPTVGPDGVPIGEIPTPEINSDAPSLTGYVNLNIRSGPGVSYDVIGILKKQKRVEVVGVSADGLWWAIKYAKGPNGRGWVSGQYVVTSNVGDVPILEK